MDPVLLTDWLRLLGLHVQKLTFQNAGKLTLCALVQSCVLSLHKNIHIPGASEIGVKLAKLTFFHIVIVEVFFQLPVRIMTRARLGQIQCVEEQTSRNSYLENFKIPFECSIEIAGHSSFRTRYGDNH